MGEALYDCFNPFVQGSIRAYHDWCDVTVVSIPSCKGAFTSLSQYAVLLSFQSLRAREHFDGTAAYKFNFCFQSLRAREHCIQQTLIGVRRYFNPFVQGSIHFRGCTLYVYVVSIPSCKGAFHR